MASKFIINGLNIKDPSTLNFKKENIVNQERTMNGTLVVDYIASKEVVQVSWDILDDESFNKLLKVIEGKQEDKSFYSITYLKPDSTSKTVDAYAESVSYFPYFSDDTLIWRDVSMTFSEV